MSLPIETRAQHLEWCKKRALDELNRPGDVQECLRLNGQRLGKHPETEGHIAIQLGMSLMMADQREASDREAMRQFINGFN